MKLPSDIVDYIRSNFPRDAAPQVMEEIQSARLHNGQEPVSRMLRCVLVGSGKSLERLRQLVSALAVDFRDVIVAGEYVEKEGSLVQIRDLTKPFSASETRWADLCYWPPPVGTVAGLGSIAIGLVVGSGLLD